MPRSARETGNEPALTLLALRDRGNEVARRYGIDLGAVSGEWVLPMPARFVIDRDGIVRSVETDPEKWVSRRPEWRVGQRALRQRARTSTGHFAR